MESIGATFPGIEQEGMDLEGGGGMERMQVGKKQRIKSVKADYVMSFTHFI